jgi:hypothetical protein
VPTVDVVPKMLQFKGGKQEQTFQEAYAKQHIRGDFVLCIVGWIMSVVVLTHIWKVRDLRALHWHVTFTSVITAEKVLSTEILVLFGTWHHPV